MLNGLKARNKCHPRREEPDWANDIEAEESGHMLALDALPSEPSKDLYAQLLRSYCITLFWYARGSLLYFILRNSKCLRFLLLSQYFCHIFVLFKLLRNSFHLIIYPKYIMYMSISIFLTWVFLISYATSYLFFSCDILQKFLCITNLSL